MNIDLARSIVREYEEAMHPKKHVSLKSNGPTVKLLKSVVNLRK